MRNRKDFCVGVFAISFSGFALTAASGADRTWDGDGNGQNGKNWGNANAWASGLAPSTLDNAIFTGITAFNNAPYQPALYDSNGNTAISANIAGLHFNNTTPIVLSIPDGGGLSVSNTTLVSRSASVVKLDNGTGVFTTNNLSVASGATFTIPSVTVAGRLSGVGAIAGNVTVNAIHSVGGSSTLAGSYTGGIGSQAVTGNLTYGATSIFSWDLNAPNASGGGVNNQGTYDTVSVTGTIGASSAVFEIVLASGDNFTDAFWDSTRTWTNIFGSATNLASVFGGGFGGVGANAVGSNGTVAGQGQFSFSGGTLTWNAVPEPTSAMAGLILGMGMFRRRRLA